MFSKKGISPVVATVMIVMLTVVAVSALAAVIVPFVKNSLTKSGECLPYQDYFTFYEAFSYNCYQKSGMNNLYGFSVKAKYDESLVENLDGFVAVLISDDGTRKSITVNDSSTGGQIWTKGNAITSMVKAPGAGEIRTYVYNSSDDSKFNEMEIHARLKDGKICKEKDSIKLSECSVKLG